MSGSNKCYEEKVEEEGEVIEVLFSIGSGRPLQGGDIWTEILLN